jgi:hypothetical protein
MDLDRVDQARDRVAQYRMDLDRVDQLWTGFIDTGRTWTGSIDLGQGSSIQDDLDKVDRYRTDLDKVYQARAKDLDRVNRLGTGSIDTGRTWTGSIRPRRGTSTESVDLGQGSSIQDDLDKVERYRMDLGQG